MRKRYQVFVSSTYDDLRAERQEVMHALLELDCIPAGMELFPATSQDLWTLIREVIDHCDYYIVIVAARYGSVDSNGMGFTEKECRYALDKGKPVIAFLHRDPDALPAEKTEQAPEMRRRLAAFRQSLEQRVCKYWRTPVELGSVMGRSLVRLIRTHPAVGWVRADSLAGPEAMAEIVRLRKRIEQLEDELAATSPRPPAGTEDLAQGDDGLTISYTFRPLTADPVALEETLTTTWNDVFSAVSPCLMAEASERQMRAALNRFVKARTYRQLKGRSHLQMLELGDFQISELDLQTIKVQLRALGLIAPGTRRARVEEGRTCWTLTRYGDVVMTKLRAIRRNAASPKTH